LKLFIQVLWKYLKKKKKNKYDQKNLPYQFHNDYIALDNKIKNGSSRQKEGSAIGTLTF